MKRIFISVPYNGPTEEIKLARVHLTKLYFISVLKAGNCPVSPIVTGHQLVEEFNLMGDLATWIDYCKKELMSCDEMVVLQLDGWDESPGVKAEIELAKFMNIPVTYTKHLACSQREMENVKNKSKLQSTSQ